MWERGEVLCVDFGEGRVEDVWIFSEVVGVHDCGGDRQVKSEVID